MSTSPWRDFAEQESAGSRFPDQPSPGTAGRSLADEASRGAPGGSVGPVPGEVPLTVRLVTGAAGLLAAGGLVLGIVMTVVMVVLQIKGGQSGLETTAGPGWLRTSAQLVGGVVGEVLFLSARRHRSFPIRVLVAALSIVLVLLTLWWVWWR